MTTFLIIPAGLGAVRQGCHDSLDFTDFAVLYFKQPADNPGKGPPRYRYHFHRPHPRDLDRLYGAGVVEHESPESYAALFVNDSPAPRLYRGDVGERLGVNLCAAVRGHRGPF